MVGYRCRNDVQGLDFRGVSICPELGLWLWKSSKYFDILYDM